MPWLTGLLGQSSRITSVSFWPGAGTERELGNRPCLSLYTQSFFACHACGLVWRTGQRHSRTEPKTIIPAQKKVLLRSVTPVASCRQSISPYSLTMASLLVGLSDVLPGRSRHTCTGHVHTRQLGAQAHRPQAAEAGGRGWDHAAPPARPPPCSLGAWECGEALAPSADGDAACSPRPT